MKPRSLQKGTRSFIMGSYVEIRTTKFLEGKHVFFFKAEILQFIIQNNFQCKIQGSTYKCILYKLLA